MIYALTQRFSSLIVPMLLLPVMMQAGVGGATAEGIAASTGHKPGVLVSAASNHEGAGTAHLVTLERVGPVPYIAPGFWSLGGPRHHSAILSFEQGAHGPWHIFVIYMGCPVTAAGSLRITLYKAARRGTTQIQDFHRSRQYSHTLIERSRSGSGDYLFPGAEGTDYFIRVVVPSKAGCASWRITTELA